MSPLEKLGVHTLKTNNLFNFGLESCTTMEKPAELVQSATVYLSWASASLSHLIRNRIQSAILIPETPFWSKIARPQNSNLFQQQYLTGVPSLKPPSRGCTAEQFLSPSPGSTFACGVSFLYSTICMLPRWKKPSWNRFRVEGSCTLQVQLYYILSVVPQRKDCDNRDILLVPAMIWSTASLQLKYIRQKSVS